MSRPRRHLGTLGVVLVVGVLAAGIHLRLKAAEESEEEQTAAAIVQGLVPTAASALAGDIAIPVRGAEAVRGTMILSVQASGQTAAWRRTVITPQVAGRITAVQARENAGWARSRCWWCWTRSSTSGGCRRRRCSCGRRRRATGR